MQKTGFIPLLTTPAGSCLTMANWQQAGVKTLSLRLEQLLMKPGLSVLQACKDLRSWCGWQGNLVLNALFSLPEQEGIFSIRSQYDGSVQYLQSASVFELIAHLQPDRVILPAGDPSYIMGDFGAADLQQLVRAGHLVESDKPAADGRQGIVYHQEAGCLEMFAKDWSTDHQPIDKNCACNTCRQGLTRAYLHHLLPQVPLLCQRFLIQHNIHVCSSFT